MPNPDFRVTLTDFTGNAVSAAGGVASTTADGADVTQGAIADAAVTGDNTGTVNAHLRGLTKTFVPTLPSDAVANPTVSTIQALYMIYNAGSDQWLRFRRLTDVN